MVPTCFVAIISLSEGRLCYLSITVYLYILLWTIMSLDGHFNLCQKCTSAHYSDECLSNECYHNKWGKLYHHSYNAFLSFLLRPNIFLDGHFDMCHKSTLPHYCGSCMYNGFYHHKWEKQNYPSFNAFLSLIYRPKIFLRWSFCHVPQGHWTSPL